jgi:glucan phosphoethanolaminetransferase (alkaline phosphatase superfamily)
MGLGLLQGLWLLLLGVLGASSLVARREEGRKALAVLEPYQGWIGVASVVWGAWRLVALVLAMRYRPWLVSLVVAGLFICLGLLLGVGIIQSFLKDPKGRENFEKLVQKLTPYRQTLGVVAMVLGGFGILSAIL